MPRGVETTVQGPQVFPRDPLTKYLSCEMDSQALLEG